MMMDKDIFKNTCLVVQLGRLKLKHMERRKIYVELLN